MKIQITLNDTHKNILLMLGNSTYPNDFHPDYVSYYDIKRTIEAFILLKNKVALGEILKTIAGRKKYTPIIFPVNHKPNDIEKALEQLIEYGLLNKRFKPSGGSLDREDLTMYDYELTKEGKRISNSINENRIINFRPQKTLRKNVFVASAFGHSEIDDLYDNYIVPVCKKFGYETIRVDLNEPAKTITNEILEGICSSEFLIADLTYARPSVYFEVGYANGLGIPLLLTCNKNHFKGKNDDRKVHFDLEQYKISFWTKINKKIVWERKMSINERIKILLSNKSRT